jgi:hypothetical protein
MQPLAEARGFKCPSREHLPVSRGALVPLALRRPPPGIPRWDRLPKVLLRLQFYAPRDASREQRATACQGANPGAWLSLLGCAPSVPHNPEGLLPTSRTGFPVADSMKLKINQDAARVLSTQGAACRAEGGSVIRTSVAAVRRGPALGKAALG